MTFDGFFIHHLIKELNTHIKKSRLEKIYQKNELSFLFVFYIKKERFFVMIDLDPNHFGMYITEYQEIYQQQSQFLSTLRKHLEGAILEEITQHETDRVIKLTFTVYDFILGPLKKELIFEAMGKHSNLILVYDGLIVDTVKKMFFESGRQLLPQATFEYFPTDKKPFFHIAYENISQSQDLVKQYMGISPLLANYLIEHPVQLEEIKIKPTYIKSSNQSYVFDVFSDEHDKAYTDTISKLFELDDDTHEPTFLSQRNFILKQLKKYEKKRELLQLSLEEALEGLNEKTKGDFIYMSGLNLSEKHSEITVSDLRIVLDPMLTLNENAQKHYKLYQKSKRSIDYIKAQIDENDQLIDLFMNLSDFIELQTQETMKDFEKELITYGYKAVKQKVIHKKHQQKPNIWMIEDSDATYAVGKNNVQNEYVTHTYADKEDYFFHVKDAPGAHVIVKTSVLNEPIIRKASMLAAYFSKMKASSSIPVDYTKVKFLKKIPAKPRYQVIYQQYKTIFIDIDESKMEALIRQASKK